jgi:hypothetical protein
MELKEIHAAITAIVDAAKVMHPDLKLSFGYIGNYDRRLPQPDDRSWYVFTNIGAYKYVACSKVNDSPKFGGYDTHDLPLMLRTMQQPDSLRNFDAFLDRAEEKRLDTK